VPLNSSILLLDPGRASTLGRVPARSWVVRAAARLRRRRTPPGELTVQEAPAVEGLSERSGEKEAGRVTETTSPGRGAIKAEGVGPEEEGRQPKRPTIEGKWEKNNSL
jgi:hypothetical protein